jgi:hypothetical protein
MKVVDRRQQAVLMPGVFDEVLQPSHTARAPIADEGVPPAAAQPTMNDRERNSQKVLSQWCRMRGA